MNESFRTYLFTYQHDGACWGFEIQAKDPDDARDRIGKLLYATYEGEVMATVPATYGPLVRIATWARNLLQAQRPVR